MHTYVGNYIYNGKRAPKQYNWEKATEILFEVALQSVLYSVNATKNRHHIEKGR